MKGGTLKQASKLYRSRKYADVIHLLEPQVFRFRESFRFYYFLGLSCLHTGDFGGAFSYLSRAENLKKDDVDVLNALAAIYLKRRETEDALRLWLRVIDAAPKNRIASRGLALLKKDLEPETLYTLVETKSFKKYLPEPGVFLRFLPVVIVLAVLIPLILIGGPRLYERLLNRGQNSRPGSEVIRISEEELLTEYSGAYRYILTDRELSDTFTRIDRNFADLRDNLVMKDINYILGSNAVPELKQKVRLLSTYLSEPTFTTLRDSFSFAEVGEDPFLYNGCHVAWKGRASNISVTEDEITFDFLVGYHENKVLEGVVPVELTFAAHISQNTPIEILGRIQTDGRNIMLTALSIHQLEP